MTRASAPTLHCDHEGGCDEWTIDDLGLYVDSVNGVRLSARHRALGWTTVGDEDFCSEHAPDRENGSER